MNADQNFTVLKILQLERNALKEELNIPLPGILLTWLVISILALSEKLLDTKYKVATYGNDWGGGQLWNCLHWGKNASLFLSFFLDF